MLHAVAVEHGQRAVVELTGTETVISRSGLRRIGVLVRVEPEARRRPRRSWLIIVANGRLVVERRGVGRRQVVVVERPGGRGSAHANTPRRR